MDQNIDLYATKFTAKQQSLMDKFIDDLNKNIDVLVSEVGAAKAKEKLIADATGIINQQEAIRDAYVSGEDIPSAIIKIKLLHAMFGIYAHKADDLTS